MQRNPVSSSTIRAVGYDPKAAVLEVEFVNGGVYQYSAVEAETYIGLAGAQSAGKFFASAVRGKYATRRT